MSKTSPATKTPTAKTAPAKAAAANPPHAKAVDGASQTGKAVKASGASDKATATLSRESAQPVLKKPVAAPATAKKSTGTPAAKTTDLPMTPMTPTKTAPAPLPGAATAAAASTPPSAPAPALVPVTPKKSSRGASKYGAPAVQAPLPPPTSRFADRFAPPRPPTRQMNNLELDTPKHAQKSDPKLVNAWKSKAGRELSEPELLAMPESEYMNDKQLDFFRARLQALKDDLLSNAGETTEHLREDTSIVPDPADRATIEEEHALELRTRDRERKLLKKISQSLGRIESGEYGFCDETGEPIGLGRLIARPTATLSLEAQQRRELKQKMFGD